MWFPRAVLVLAVAALAIAWSPERAQATLGVGVTNRSISINEELRPGDSCKLPEIGVANTGDEKAAYDLTFVNVPDPGRLDADPAWFIAEPSTVIVEPGRIKYATVSLEVPTDAKPGRYLGVVQVSAINQVPGGNPIVLAAGTKIFFTVAGTARTPAQVSGSPQAPAKDSGRPSTFLAVAGAVLGLLLLAILVIISKNLRLSISWGKHED